MGLTVGTYIRAGDVAMADSFTASSEEGLYFYKGTTETRIPISYICVLAVATVVLSVGEPAHSLTH